MDKSLVFQKERISGLHADHGVCVNRPDVGHDQALMKEDKDPRRHGDREEIRDDRERRDRDHIGIDYEHDGNRDISKQCLTHKRQLFCSGADQLHQDGEDNENFGALRGSSSYDDKTAVKSEYYYWLHFLVCI